MEGMKLKIAQEMLKVAEKKAEEMGVPMVISVVDDGGNLVASQRMDDALLISIDISINKAWTAAALKLPTDVLATVASPGGELYGINTTNNSRVVMFGGGIPLKADGKIIGAIGVSGGSVTQDIEVAEAGASILSTLQE